MFCNFKYYAIKDNQECWVDVNTLPKKKYGGALYVDWRKASGERVNFKYKDVHGFLEVSHVSGQTISVKYKNMRKTMGYSQLRQICLGGFFKRSVQSRYIPEFQNSLANNKHAIKYIKNQEEAKMYSTKSSKKVECICPECGDVKKITAKNLTNHGFVCMICTESLSYPEKLVREILEDNSIAYEPQKRFEECRRKKPLPFDFYVDYKNKRYCIETHGAQHYMENSDFFRVEEIQESDKIKENFCRQEGIEYIAIDCRISDFTHISENILASPFGRHVVQTNWEAVYKNLEKKQTLPREYVITEYQKGKSISAISKYTGITRKRCVEILKHAKVYVPPPAKRISTEVVAVQEKLYFNNIKEATDYAGLRNTGQIARMCIGDLKSAGKHPVTGEKLKWMYYEDYIEKYGTEGLTEYVEGETHI